MYVQQLKQRKKQNDFSHKRLKIGLMKKMRITDPEFESLKSITNQVLFFNRAMSPMIGPAASSV